ncbi:non-ribosomal peptide synthetase, partial [Gordonia sp. UBA7860]
MTGPTGGHGIQARGWGRTPSLIDLIGATADAYPDAVAFTGAGGPVPFSRLAAQASVTARALAAQGLDADAAVRATVTGLVARPGLSPAEVAEASAAAIESVRRAVDELFGSSDRSSLPGLVRSSVHRFPDRVAITDPAGASLTYRELDRRSHDIALRLVDRGAGPETLVGVALPRTAELIVVLVAIARTGAAYLPLDRSHPIERLSTIVDDAAPAVIVADSETTHAWSATAFGDMVSTVDDLLDVAPRATTLPARVDPAHPAYVMYTSGSTGKPKGVAVTHEDVVSLLDAMSRMYDYTEHDVWTMFQSYAFDVSVGEIWVSLAFGGRLVVLDYETTRSPADFVKILDREQVTIVNLTPSAFYQLAAAVRPPSGARMPSSVRSMIFVGEALDFEQVRRWHTDRLDSEGDPGPQLNNMYGPTEATVYMTRRELTVDFVSATSASDIGGPIPGTRTYILDRRLASVPDGIPGELYIAGPQVARGYLGRFELNATRFVADPFGAPGDRMYRTGDVAIPRAGSIEYLGRSDAQVKLRGFRIELGEVEAALLAAVGVDAAAAAIKTRDDGPTHLVGYVVGRGLDVSAIRAEVAQRVPDYMVPDVIMELEQLPLNVNGKLDRAALPLPRIESTAEFVAPRSEYEHRLADVYAEVLGLDSVSVIESLFDLGGNSLVAAQVAARASEVLQLPVSVRDVFTSPAVADLAQQVAGRVAVDRPELAAVDRQGAIPLSYAQQRLWFLAQLEPDNAVYNIPLVLHFSGALDTHALAGALDDVVRRHEVLRTRFPVRDGVAEQEIGDDAPDIIVADPITTDPSDVEEKIAEIAWEPFRLADAPPLRARLLQTGRADYILVLVVHHVIADGASMGPLARDVIAGYRARSEGESADFGKLAVQYADYTLWQRAVLGDPRSRDSIAGRQLAFWRETLDGAADLIDLPLDHLRPATQSKVSRNHQFSIGAGLAAELDEFALEHGVSLFMLLHAMWLVLLNRLSGSADITIGTPYAGRGERALDDLVGMFVNSLALRTRFGVEDAFTDLLAVVKETDLAAISNADVPFEMVVEQLDLPRTDSHAPVFQVALALQDHTDSSFELPGVAIEFEDHPRTLTDYDLSVTFIESWPAGDRSGHYLRGNVDYAADLFDPRSVARFIEFFERIARQVVAEPDMRICDVEILESEHRDDLVVAGALPSPELTLPQMLARAASNSDALALVSGDESMTYGELDARSNQFARFLITRGVGPETSVVSACRRGISGQLAFWAIAKAGGALCQVDPAYPTDRIAMVVADSGAPLGVVEPESVSAMPYGAHWVVVDDDLWAQLDTFSVAPLSADELIAPVRVDNAAYIIFTSGSTGRPKGSAVTHRATTTVAALAAERFGLSSSSRMLAVSSPSFDAAVFESLVTYGNGATLVLSPPQVYGGAELADVIVRQQVSHAVIVPSVLATIPGLPDDALPVLMTAGEALPHAEMARWVSGDSARRMSNLYGPSESTIIATSAGPLRRDEPVTIGDPVAGITVAVLDERLRPV